MIAYGHWQDRVQTWLELALWGLGIWAIVTLYGKLSEKYQQRHDKWYVDIRCSNSGDGYRVPEIRPTHSVECTCDRRDLPPTSGTVGKWADLLPGGSHGPPKDEDSFCALFQPMYWDHCPFRSSYPGTPHLTSDNEEDARWAVSKGCGNVDGTGERCQYFNNQGFLE